MDGNEKLASILLENTETIFKTSAAFILKTYGYDIVELLSSKVGKDIKGIILELIADTALKNKKLKIVKTDPTSYPIDFSFSLVKNLLFFALEDTQIGNDKAAQGLINLGFDNAKASLKAAKGDWLGAGIDLVWAEVEGVYNLSLAGVDVIEDSISKARLATGNAIFIKDPNSRLDSVIVDLVKLETAFLKFTPAEKQKFLDRTNLRFKNYPKEKEIIFRRLQEAHARQLGG